MNLKKYSTHVRNKIMRRKLDIIFQLKYHRFIKHYTAKYLIDRSSDLSALANMNKYFGIERFFGWSQTDVSQHNFRNGRTALTLAVDLRRSEIVKYLIPRGIDLHTKENKAALYLAINNGDTEVAKLLIDAGADVNYIYKDTKSINSNGSIDVVTPLILAVCKRNHQVVKYLLNKGVDMNAICTDEELLVLAALYDNKDLVEYYINDGINVNAVVSLQNTKLCSVIYNNSRRKVIAGDICAIYNSATALDITIQSGNNKLFDLLIKSSADISKTVHNKNPLHFAVRNNYCHIVEYLVKNGADVNSIEDDRSLLIEAVYCKHLEVVELLLKNKVDVNLQSESGMTALDVAINEKNYLLMTILMEFGAINTQYHITNKPILYSAIENCSYHYAVAIINRGTNVNIIFNKKTLLHVALKKGNVEVINHLLYSGFDVNYQDEDKKTAVNYEYVDKFHYAEDDGFIYCDPVEVSYIEPVKQHVVKLLMAGFYVCEQNTLAVETGYDYLRRECAKEIESMKQIFIISGIKISYYDLLYGLHYKLAPKFKFIFRSNNKNEIISIVKNINSSFPQYGKMIHFCIKNIFDRAELLVKTDNVMMEIFEDLLEADIVLEIVKYLTTEEMKIICRFL